MVLRKEKTEATFFVELTASERGARAKECTKTITELEVYEDAYKEYKKVQLKHIRDEKTRVHQLSKAAMTGQEQQTIECEEIFDVTAKKTWYLHKGKKYESRDMTDGEIAAQANEPIFKEPEVDAHMEPAEVPNGVNPQIPF